MVEELAGKWLKVRLLIEDALQLSEKSHENLYAMCRFSSFSTQCSWRMVENETFDLVNPFEWRSRPFNLRLKTQA
ncbi:Uncharacterised protein [uncultured archaeon]|nr:Uncharacterised protein [uncultured archaeon]